MYAGPHNQQEQSYTPSDLFIFTSSEAVYHFVFCQMYKQSSSKHSSGLALITE